MRVTWRRHRGGDRVFEHVAVSAVQLRHSSMTWPAVRCKQFRLRGVGDRQFAVLWASSAGRPVCRFDAGSAIGENEFVFWNDDTGWPNTLRWVT